VGVTEVVRAFLTCMLCKNLEVLAIDEIVILDEEIAGIFHFAPDLLLFDSVTK
jgi:hypothetical protein